MASGPRGILGTTSLILLAGSIVLIFFVVLSGVTGTTPLDKTYFLRADTSGINGARTESQWTYFYVCGAGNTDCGAAVPALSIGTAWSTGTGDGAPAALLGKHAKGTTSSYYYYVWRFGWVFYLMGLVLDVLGFFAALAAPFSRLASGFSSLIVFSALFFFTLGASLMTAEFVKARDHFNSVGLDAHVGTYAFGFTWGAWAAIFIAAILLFGGVFTGRSETTTRETSAKAAANPNSRGFFRRQRGRRAGSIGVDGESTHRVKEEY